MNLLTILTRSCRRSTHSVPIERMEPRLLMSVSTAGWEGPTTPGTVWSYFLNRSAGFVFQGSSIVTVIGPTTFAGNAATEIDSTFYPFVPSLAQPTTSRMYTALTAEGYVTYGRDQLIFTPPRLDLPAVLTAGVAIHRTDPNDPNEIVNITDTLESETPQLVTVQAGTFSCYVIDEVDFATPADGSISTPDYQIYYSPGVGRVQTVSTGQVGNSELSAFSAALAHPDHLVIAAQSFAPGDTSHAPITVDVEDALGNIIAGANDSVTLSLVSNGGTGILSGTLTQPAPTGVATFSDLSISSSGTYILQATESQTGLVSSPTPVVVTLATKGLLPSVTLIRTSSIVAGSKANDTVELQLTNTTPLEETGRESIRIFATSSAGSVFTLAKVIRDRRILAGNSILLKVPVSMKSLPIGSYTVLAQTVDASGYLLGSIAGPTFTVLAPVVDVGATITRVTPATIRHGRAATIHLDLFNIGNVEAHAEISIMLSISTNPDGSSPSQSIAVARHIQIPPGKHRSLAIPRFIPSSFPSGTYFFVVDVDPANSLNDPDLVNDLAISPAVVVH